MRRKTHRMIVLVLIVVMVIARVSVWHLLKLAMSFLVIGMALRFAFLKDC